MSFTNPSSGFPFYVGVGIPTLSRFATLRAGALIVGPGLPALSENELAVLPLEVRQDPAGIGVGGLLHQSPDDQSTCDHLGPTMKRSSRVRNGRCDFYEPYGRTNSWRVLGADNVLPIKGATYHVAVWLPGDVSGKFGVAVGTHGSRTFGYRSH